MAYSTNTEIASEFKNITFSSSTSVTSTEVDTFIAQADAFIDGYLSGKYVVPITGATALLIVKQLSIDLVARRVKKIMAVKTGTTPEEQAGAGVTPETVEEKLEKMRIGDILLPGATLADSDDGVSSYVKSNDVPFKFERDTEQW